jgi:predicted HTH transcriptional regulator
MMTFRPTGMSWDRLPVTNALIDEIDLEKVKQYIESARDAGRRKISGGEKPLQILEKLEVIKDGKVTWAAILLFYKHPQRFLSQAVIYCGKFKEETIVVDDRMIEGTVIEQIEEALDFIRKNINVKFVMTGKPARQEVWDYPLEALREAVINAVCHRDYTIPSNTEVRIYDDELVVWNPGGLPLGLTEEDLYKPLKAVMYVKQKGKITNREYREMFSIKNRMALIDLSGLCEKQILTRVGKTGRGTEYILIGQTRNKPEIDPIYLSPLEGEGMGEGAAGCKILIMG